MKRVVQHPTSSDTNGPRYWRSLGELTQTPGFKAHLEREFPEGASSIEGVDRRGFMKIMAASFALAGIGLAGCRRPEKYILPYGKSVEGVIPGLPLYFATSMSVRGTAIPLLAETHSGRPTKIEGNPTYASYGGASTLISQASILDLYDPDRATSSSRAGASIDAAAVADLLAGIGRDFDASAGEGLAFLADKSSSPSRASVVARLRSRFPKATWAEYEPVRDEAPVEAALACFGRSVKPVYHYEKATRILSLDCDFLGAEAGSIAWSRQFSKGRRVSKPGDSMNRLYVAESSFSITGSMADHRLRIASGHVLALAAAIAEAAGATGDLGRLAAGCDVSKDWIRECAADLVSARGASLVVAGAHQPPAVHAIAYGLNVLLGNVGATLDFVEIPASSAGSIQELSGRISAGAVKTLVVVNGNPAYNAPAELGFAALLAKVPQVIRFGTHADETSALSQVHVAAAHYLESWGDARTIEGTLVPVQPMIVPLFGGLSELEFLARIAGNGPTDAHTIVFQTVTSLVSGDSAKVFERFLHDGLLSDTAYPVVKVSFDHDRVRPLLNAAGTPKALSSSSLEVRFVADYKTDDGRFANNGWLQECPDPITKISWDNAILVSPRLAKELGIDPKGSLIQVARKENAEFEAGKESAPIFELTLEGRTLRAPVHIQPGLSNYTVVIALGYGRTQAGRVGTGAGVNAYAIRSSSSASFGAGATLRDTGERMQLANTQEHWSMEGRDLVREANLDEYEKNPAFVAAMGLEAHSPAVYGKEGATMSLGAKAAGTPRGNSMYETPDMDGTHQWGMSIDLNVCTGCNACVVACQAENNIPIVGRDQVMRGREMHWIRLDRYYSDGLADAGAFGGEHNRELPEDPQVSIQPIACAQCELAPCETVCPVNATVHDMEGLNTMAYNRCIGTRYCANNCPYKVRRFNFFDYNQRQLDSLYMGPLGPQGMPELVQMAKNPEVTVRMRGVMEKCTYCVQRIQNGKIQHRARMSREGRQDAVQVPDGTIKTACQQVCPAEAIVFGNLLDENSEVSKAKHRSQDYALLGYLNVRPRTTYLGKLRNPNPRMPDYKALPHSRTEYNSKSGHAAHDSHEVPAAKGTGDNHGGHH